MAENYIKAGMGEIVSGSAQDTLVAYGIGSCVVVTCFDPVKVKAAMLHALLPEKLVRSEHRSKYADTGVEDLIKHMIDMGCSVKDLKAKLFGGAKMFDIGNKTESIGERNVKMARDILERKGIPVCGEDTGSNYGRTIEFDIKTGIATVKSFGKGTITV